MCFRGNSADGGCRENPHPATREWEPLVKKHLETAGLCAYGWPDRSSQSGYVKSSCENAVLHLCHAVHALSGTPAMERIDPCSHRTGLKLKRLGDPGLPGRLEASAAHPGWASRSWRSLETPRRTGGTSGPGNCAEAAWASRQRASTHVDMIWYSLLLRITCTVVFHMHKCIRRVMISNFYGTSKPRPCISNRSAKSFARAASTKSILW